MPSGFPVRSRTFIRAAALAGSSRCATRTMASFRPSGRNSPSTVLSEEGLLRPFSALRNVSSEIRPMRAMSARVRCRDLRISLRIPGTPHSGCRLAMAIICCLASRCSQGVRGLRRLSMACLTGRRRGHARLRGGHSAGRVAAHRWNRSMATACAMTIDNYRSAGGIPNPCEPPAAQFTLQKQVRSGN